MRQLPKRRFSLILAVVVLFGAVVLGLFLWRTALALQAYRIYSTVVDFNAGTLYHTALSWRDDGEIQLLPIGLAHPWEPGNNNGLPPRSAHSAVYVDQHIYVIGGDSELGATWNDVFYTTVYTDVTTVTERLSDWITTTALPADVYPEGVYEHDSVALNGYIYVFGGKEDEGGSSSYYDNVVFAPIQPDGSLGDWQQATPLPTPLLGMESAALHGCVYVLGGLDPTGHSVRDVYFARPDPVTGQISFWTATTALPNQPIGGYYGAASAVLNGRIYVYGGASGVTGPTVSPFIYLTEPNSVTCEIGSWSLNPETLGLNLYASEGAAYRSGLLLAIAGANNNIYNPSGDVMAGLVYSDTGQTGEWVTTLGLTPGRFWHRAVQDEDGWLYAVGGSTGYGGDRLNEVQIATPYSGGGGGGGLYRTPESTSTVYAPDGTFTSPLLDLRPAWWFTSTTVTGLAWNTTVTDSEAMGVGLEYRYRRPPPAGSWTDWYGPFASPSGGQVTTSLEVSHTCDLFQYRATLTTTVITQTPLLNAVRVSILLPPDLIVSNVTITGCSSCPDLIPVNQPVQFEFTVHNEGSDVRGNNNFFAVFFLTTTAGFFPTPPDSPIGCEGYPTVTCPLILPMYGEDFEEGSTHVIRTTYTFESPGTYYLLAYADYNNSAVPPAYDIREYQEDNNFGYFIARVGDVGVFLPLVFKNLTPPGPTPTPIPPTPTPSPLGLQIAFVSGYPCLQEGNNQPIRVKAYVTDNGGLPVSDATVTVSIAGGGSQLMLPIAGKPGYYGSGTGCWESAPEWSSHQNVTVSAAKDGYTGATDTTNTSSNPPCSTCP
jgi:hypothetical protein